MEMGSLEEGNFLKEVEDLFPVSGNCSNNQAESVQQLNYPQLDVEAVAEGSSASTRRKGRVGSELIGNFFSASGNCSNNQAESVQQLNNPQPDVEAVAEGSSASTRRKGRVGSELIGNIFPASGDCSNNQAESVQQMNNPQPDVEAVAEGSSASTRRKRRVHRKLVDKDERRRKKNAWDKNYRKTKKDKCDRLTKIAEEYGGIEQMESDFPRLEDLKSRYGGFEEIDSMLKKLKQMEADSAVFEKVKDMFGGIDKIESGLDRLKNVFTTNQTEMALLDRLQSSSDPLQDLQDESNHGTHSIYSHNQGSTGCSAELQVQEDSILGMSLAVEAPYCDKLAAGFIEELEKERRSGLDFCSFKGLDGERQRVGNYSFPTSLVDTVNKITKAHGDVTRNCLMGPAAAENAYVLFCAAIKEMGDLSLKHVTEEIMLKWKDAIDDARRIGFVVEFARDHLKTIAYAYFGLKARNRRTSLERRKKTLRDNQNYLKQMLEKNEEEENTVEERIAKLTSSQCNRYLAYADHFGKKNVGPFPDKHDIDINVIDKSTSSFGEV